MIKRRFVFEYTVCEGELMEVQEALEIYGPYYGDRCAHNYIEIDVWARSYDEAKRILIKRLPEIVNRLKGD